jgi:hypothetical protein
MRIKQRQTEAISSLLFVGEANLLDALNSAELDVE